MKRLNSRSARVETALVLLLLTLASLNLARMSSTTPQQLSENHTFGGVLRKLKAPSAALGLETQFNVFLPKQALDGSKVP